MLTAGDVLQFVGWGYIGVAVLAIALAVILAKGGKTKIVSALVLVGLFSVWPVLRLHTTKRQLDDHAARLKLATERFEARCKSAGEKIVRTVDNVDGILLLKVRPKRPATADTDPMWAGAALPQESTDDEYIQSFLLYEWRGKGFEHQRGNLNAGPTEHPGYRFVDVEDPDNNRRYRYTVDFEALSDAGGIAAARRFKLKRSETNAPVPRYAVTYKDIVDPEDRKYWIAGVSIQVIDLEKKEVLAEQTGFLMDPGQGNTSGSRDPWGWAASYGPRCPSRLGGGSHTRFFVDQILKPRQGG